MENKRQFRAGYPLINELNEHPYLIASHEIYYLDRMHKDAVFYAFLMPCHEGGGFTLEVLRSPSDEMLES